jgi:hypothetical protein
MEKFIGLLGQTLTQTDKRSKYERFVVRCLAQKEKKDSFSCLKCVGPLEMP